MTTLELIDSYWVYFLVGQYTNGPLGGLALIAGWVMLAAAAWRGAAP